MCQKYYPDLFILIFKINADEKFFFENNKNQMQITTSCVSRASVLFPFFGQLINENINTVLKRRCFGENYTVAQLLG